MPDEKNKKLNTAKTYSRPGTVYHRENPSASKAMYAAGHPIRKKHPSPRPATVQKTVRRQVPQKAKLAQPTKKGAVIVDLPNITRPHVTDYVPIDATFLMLVIIMTLFGLVMVFSASYAVSIKDYGNAASYFLRQLIFAALGIGGLIFFTYFDYYHLKKLAIPAMIVGIALLVAVLFVGRVSGNARRWIDIGGIGFQPSELVKIAVVIFIAKYCEDHRSTMNRLITMLVALVPIAVIDYLLYKEPHLSAMLLITGTVCVMLFAGGLNMGISVIGGGVIVAGVTAFFLFGTKLPYIKDRLAAFLDPFAVAQGDGYQTVQSLYAIGSGGLFGVGLGNSRQKQLFLPESHNDYVFSIICEELGFIGALIVIALFVMLIWRGMTIALRARDRFGFLLVTGIMTIVTFQFLLNIAVVTNAIPVTGMSLPFFSYGGTALFILLCEMGIVLNVSRQIPVSVSAKN